MANVDVLNVIGNAFIAITLRDGMTYALWNFEMFTVMLVRDVEPMGTRLYPNNSIK